MTERRYPNPATTTPERVLMIQAHPDDAEFSIGGTMAKWAADGAEIIYCSITSGDKGTRDPEITGEALISTREREQLEAADVLGVKQVIFLGYNDAEVVPDLNLRRDLARVIRQVRPTALVCMDPTTRFHGDGYINHPDHVAAGEASLAAVFPSCRDRRTFPELLEEGLEPIDVNSIYLFGTGNPDTWIDISDHFDTKLEALRKHVSQLNGDHDLAFVREWAVGNRAGYTEAPEDFGELAETFKYMYIG